MYCKVTSMKMYQLHQIRAVVQCLDYKALSKWSINQHDSGTIINHVNMSQTLNTMQTEVTDCCYSDHDCILCVITV